MDLRSGLPYFLLKNGLPFNYPKLETPVTTDVAILGGGISGALMAHYLTKAGIESVVVDARTIGLGSTAASTSLLQYEIDVPLSELIVKRGYEDASASFILCNEAIKKLKTIAYQIGMDHFLDKKSLYFTSVKKDIDFLKKEFNVRKQAGFNVEYLDGKDLHEQFGLKSEGGILSYHGAQVDAYAFTHALLQHDIPKGLTVFDRTPVKKIRKSGNHILLMTENESVIKAKKLVNATGYEVVNFIQKKIVKLNSTYAVISEHAGRSNSPSSDDTMMWNTANPYLYMTTVDGRVMIGGRDEEFYNPGRRDKLIKKKAKLLANDFQKSFPEASFKPEFSWAGTFGSTVDGLPFIGTIDKRSGIYYALGFGGNGITFSQIAAEIITDLILGQPNVNARIFSFDRA